MTEKNGKPSAKAITLRVKGSVSGAKKMKPTINKVKQTETDKKK